MNLRGPRAIVFGCVCLTAAFGAGVVYGQYTNGTQLVTVPAYGAGAAPTAAEAAAPDEVLKRLASVEAKIDRLLKLLEELDEKTPPPAVGAALQTAAETCYKCHSATAGKAEGGGMVLFGEKGDFREFSERDVDKIVTELEKGRMPPPKSKYKLAPNERAALIEAFKPTNGNGRNP